MAYRTRFIVMVGISALLLGISTSVYADTSGSPRIIGMQQIGAGGRGVSGLVPVYERTGSTDAQPGTFDGKVIVGMQQIGAGGRGVSGLVPVYATAHHADDSGHACCEDSCKDCCKDGCCCCEDGCKDHDKA